MSRSSSPSKEGVVTPSSDVETAEKINEQTTPHPRTAITLWQWVLTLAGLYIGALLYGLDTTIAADVQGPVYEAFGQIEKLPWIGVGFPMGSVAVILLVGRLYALFDVKWLTVSFIALFEIGSAVCGAAPNANALIIGRVIAGVGGAGMYIGALNYIALFTTPAEAPLYNAAIGLAWGVGAILGPVIGGAFSDSSATWRWAFYINLPLAGIMTPVYLFLFPKHDPRPTESATTKLKQIDWIGATLNAAVFVLIQVVLTFSGSMYAWGSAFTISIFVVWAVLLALYIVQQGWAIFTTVEQRIFPVHFLRSRSLVLLYLGTSAGAAGGTIVLYYIPLYFQFTRGDSALMAAVRLLPYICVQITFLMIAGALLPKVGRYAPFYLFGGILMLTGGALLFTADPTTSIARIYGYEVLVAAGAGLVFQNAYSVAAAKVQGDDTYKAIGYINVAQLGSISLGLSIAGSLFQNLGFQALKKALGGLLPEEIIRSALAGSQSPVFKMGNSEIAALAVKAVAETIAKVYGTVLAAGALLIVTSFLMRWERLRLDVVAGG